MRPFWRRRVLIAFVSLTAIACGSAYLSYQQGRDDTVQRCISGGPFRLTVAQGFDDLRRLAVKGAPDAAQVRFFRQTQPAIDRVLSDTAGERFAVKIPKDARAAEAGRITARIKADVLRLSEERCRDL